MTDLLVTAACVAGYVMVGGWVARRFIDGPYDQEDLMLLGFLTLLWPVVALPISLGWLSRGRRK